MTPGTSGKPGINRVHEILVVGAGAMGSQIAMLCALAGYRATATDITRGALRRAETDLRARADAAWTRDDSPVTTPTPRSAG